MNPIKLGAPLLLLALVLAQPASAARTGPPVCKPCGEWRLDTAASERVEAVLDMAFVKYKEPRRRNRKAPRGDLEAETAAEFENSLDLPPGPERRNELRADLTKLLRSPPTLRLRQDGDDIVIEAQDGPTRRVTPGEPHSRVDSLGTARIVSKLPKPSTLAVTETYRRKVFNRETYVLDAKTGTLTVTRTVSRFGLPAVTLHSSYQTR